MFPSDRFQYLYFYSSEISNSEAVESFRHLDNGDIEKRSYFHTIGTPYNNLLLFQVTILNVAKGVDQITAIYSITYDSPNAKGVRSPPSEPEYTVLSPEKIVFSNVQKYPNYSEKYTSNISRVLKADPDDTENVIMFVENHGATQVIGSDKIDSPPFYAKVLYKKDFGEFDNWHGTNKDFKGAYNRKFLRRVDKTGIEPNMSEG